MFFLSFFSTTSTPLCAPPPPSAKTNQPSLQGGPKGVAGRVGAVNNVWSNDAPPLALDSHFLDLKPGMVVGRGQTHHILM